MTVFGVRPPLLQFANNQRLYYWWFHRLKSVAHGLTAVDLHEAALSFEYTAKITLQLQPWAIPKTLAYVNGHSRRSDHL